MKERTGSSSEAYKIPMLLYNLDTDFIFLKRRSGFKAVSIYLALLAIVVVSIISLPFIKTDISVKTAGIVRPADERTDIRSFIPGVIDTIFFREGEPVQKNEVILRIRDLITTRKRVHHDFEVTQRKQYVHDLLLITNSTPGEQLIPQLNSSLYIEQLHHFIQQKYELDILLKKADKEVEINTPLFRDKVISPKEFFDIQNNQEKIQASIKVLLQAQLSAWQQDLSRYKLELSQFAELRNEVKANAEQFEIKASVSGIIQGITGRYAGGIVQANESICSISPESELIGECFVQTKDIGLLQPGQNARFQVTAFDYTYFGILTGKIISIDNDYTVQDNKPVFKVRCSFNATRLQLKNGFTAELKKGLDFQVNFIVASRSAWQLLFDKIDDWLNPASPSKK